MIRVIILFQNIITENVVKSSLLNMSKKALFLALNFTVRHLIWHLTDWKVFRSDKYDCNQPAGLRDIHV